MNEFDLIELLTRKLPSNDSVIVGPGDDCAVLAPADPGSLLLFKTDAVVEGVHFTSDADPLQVGHKALARVLSDIAAMAGQPVAALVTIALPAGFNADYVSRVYDGMRHLAKRYNVAIVGGETTTSPKGMLISVSLLGTVRKGMEALRSAAKVGDAIFVTGELGGSLAGRHLDFTPRLEEGAWLAAHCTLHAMIDVSDGLAGDLRHILKASHVGAELLASAIPISRAAKVAARSGTAAKPALAAALTDGEDFELLFTVKGSQAVPLLDAWKAKFPDVRLSCIGKITEKPGLRLRDATGVRGLDVHGYVHFQKS